MKKLVWIFVIVALVGYCCGDEDMNDGAPQKQTIKCLSCVNCEHLNGTAAYCSSVSGRNCFTGTKTLHSQTVTDRGCADKPLFNLTGHHAKECKHDTFVDGHQYHNYCECNYDKCNNGVVIKTSLVYMLSAVAMVFFTSRLF